ncbi:hypothetical protein [Pseudoalteromonas sp. MMG012]|uniref:hypothetical protein n=1 Tax=Pseudoalteromonas sp. MMG012 TaxID=2822686 RepID=UPI001B39F350|nr:hypothetical protein [Pseudoalteromonas sp. MMG012]MBQ4852374.1 hypothetical protein [Pseudoalteromonas sp. MMG012]
MIKKLFSKRCCAIAVASVFSTAAYSASITISDAAIERFDITQSSLKSSISNWVEGRYLPYTNDGNHFSITINGLSTVVTEEPNINCNYWVALKHLDGVPFAILSASNNKCGGIGRVVYSEEAKNLGGEKHIRVGGYAYTDKDTIVISKASDPEQIATVFSSGTKYLYFGEQNAQTDELAQFEIEVVDPQYDKVRLRLRHNIGSLSDKYLTRIGGKLTVSPTTAPTGEQSVFKIGFFNDTQANTGIQLTADDGRSVVESVYESSSLWLRSTDHTALTFSTLHHLSGINNVPNIHGKDPESLQLAQKATVADFESFHAPLKEQDYPENLTFRINEVPDMAQTQSYFDDTNSLFLESSHQDVRVMLDKIKYQSKVIGADYVYPMQSVITVENKKGDQFQIYDSRFMTPTEWEQLKNLAVSATGNREPGSVTDLSSMVLPTYIDKDHLTYLADTRCKTTGNVSYVKQTDSCVSYGADFNDLQTNEFTPRFIVAKLPTRVSADKVQNFSHKRMVSAASAVYKQAQNYLLSDKFLQRKMDLDAIEYLGYLATVGLSGEEKKQFRSYLSDTLNTDALAAMRPAAESFPLVHNVYLSQYVNGTDWFKEIESRHYDLSMGIYKPYLSTFAFEAFATMPEHANYTASPYSLLPAYNAPLVIFGTMAAALQTIEKLQGRDAAHSFYAKNGQNYHKLYKASSLILNQYGQKWIPANDRPLRRESIIYHAAYEYAQRSYDFPNEVLQSFCELDDANKKVKLTEDTLADCGLAQLHNEETDISGIKKRQIARFMRVEKTHISGGWDEILLPLIGGPLLDYVFTGSLFGEEFDGLLEELGTTDASEIELDTVGSEESAEETAEGSATTELGEELSETRFSQICPV